MKITINTNNTTYNKSNDKINSYAPGVVAAPPAGPRPAAGAEGQGAAGGLEIIA